MFKLLKPSVSVGLAAMLSIALFPASSAPSFAREVTGTEVSASTSSLTVPCYVTGYTAHARQQMAARSITEADVEETVREQCMYAHYQPVQGTWLFSGTPAVVLNSYGVVVTAFWAYAVAPQ